MGVLESLFEVGVAEDAKESTLMFSTPRKSSGHSNCNSSQDGPLFDMDMGQDEDCHEATPQSSLKAGTIAVQKIITVFLCVFQFNH